MTPQVRRWITVLGGFAFGGFMGPIVGSVLDTSSSVAVLCLGAGLSFGVMLSALISNETGDAASV